MLPICTARLAQYRLSHCKSNKPLLSHKLKCSILPHRWVLGYNSSWRWPNFPSWWFDEICSRRVVGGKIPETKPSGSSNVLFPPWMNPRKGNEGSSIHGGDSRRSKILKLPTPKVLKARCSLDTKGVVKLLQRAMVLPKKVLLRARSFVSPFVWGGTEQGNTFPREIQSLHIFFGLPSAFFSWFLRNG